MKSAVRFYTNSGLQDRREAAAIRYVAAAGWLGADRPDGYFSAAGRLGLPTRHAWRNVDHLCLALSAHDEASLRRHLARHHIQIIEEGIHGGSRGESLSLYVRDPSGNVIEPKGPPTS